MGGGISPQLRSLQQLREIKRPPDAVGPSLEMARKCVTIFSAPHFCGQFNKAAAVMSVDPESLMLIPDFEAVMGRAVARIILTSMGWCFHEKTKKHIVSLAAY
uniref:Uncharacterized protein n=1 Tax=Onchocerca volvulus TaxID=6282 RepID=A0A8R1TXZ2_ONCVO